MERPELIPVVVQDAERHVGRIEVLQVRIDRGKCLVHARIPREGLFEQRARPRVTLRGEDHRVRELSLAQV